MHKTKMENYEGTSPKPHANSCRIGGNKFAPNA